MRLIVCLLGAALAVGGCDRQKPPEQQGNAAQPATPAMLVKQIDRSHAGQPMPDIVVKDGDGEDTALNEFRGSPVLINLWATWCVPCVKELPTLDALSARKGAPDIVALNQDTGPLSSVATFLTQHGIDRLDLYQDADMAFSEKAQTPVLPTTVLYNGEGREVWRWVGDRDWTTPEAAKDLAAAG